MMMMSGGFFLASGGGGAVDDGRSRGAERGASASRWGGEEGVAATM